MKLSKKLTAVKSWGLEQINPSMARGLYFKMHRGSSGKVDLVQKWDVEEPNFLQLSRNGGEWVYFPIVWSDFKEVL
jgi:hypothetical protein